MRNTILIGLAILVVATIAASVLPASANSTDPQPGYTYIVVYKQADGSIVYAEGCPPSPANCAPTLQPGQSVVYITNNPILVKQFFADAQNAKLGNWHVNVQTQQLEITAAPTSGPVAPAFGIPLIGTVLPALAILGIATSSGLVWRRTHRHA